MTTDRTLARDLRTIADEARPVRLPDDLWQRGRRQRRRRIAASTALVVLAAALVALPLAVARPGQRAVGPADAPGAIPSTVYPPPPLQRTVQQAPAGPAALLVTGGGEFQGGDLLHRYDGRGMVVGRDGSYRMVRSADMLEAGDTLLLSPDGRYVAGDGGLEGASRSGPATVVLDLVTGDTRAYPGSTPLAWSPDGERLITTGDGALHLLDRRSGDEREVVRMGAARVAFAPDGRRLAVQSGSTLSIVDLATGDARELAELDEMERLAGPAAWRPDGRITLVSAGGCTIACSRDDLRARSPSLGYIDDQHGEFAEGPYFALGGVLSLRLLGWLPDGSPVVVAFELVEGADDLPETRWPIDGPAWQEDDTWLRGGVRLVALQEGSSRGTDLVRLPRSALQVEVARDLIAGGRFGGPAPSRWDRAVDMVLPMTSQLLLAGLGLAALLAVRPVLRRVRRRRAGG